MHSLIRFGDRSAKVADVQARLRALGYVLTDETGFFGPGTRDCVRAFQQRRQVLVDGIVGPHTWNELVSASWRLGDRTLYLRRPLMRGDDVATLQARLNAVGFDSGREDGIFGRQTATAVRAFQKEYGIAEDAIWGPAGQVALEGLRIDRPGVAAHLREQLRRARPGGLADALVVVDPGHGGSEPGCVAPNGMREADLCWDLAARMAAALRSRGARVRFTRTENENPDNTQRARLANEMRAHLFVSLHFNEHDQPTAEGASTYYFGSSRAGEALADLIQKELVNLGARDCRTHARSYPVLKETRMTAVLVEPAFLTNPEEADRSSRAEWREELATVIAAAIDRYFSEATD